MLKSIIRWKRLLIGSKRSTNGTASCELELHTERPKLKILITGAGGFIGRHLAQSLRKGNELYLLDISRHLNLEGSCWLELDLTTAFSAKDLPGKVDIIIHLAQAREYHDFPNSGLEIFQLNASSTLKLLEYGRKAGVRKFLYASTGSVYSGAKRRFRETDSASGEKSFYALSKYQGEGLVKAYAPYMDVTIFRFFAVYGPDQKEKLIPTLVERVRNGQHIQIYGEEGIRLNPIYVDDAVEVIIRAFSLKGSNILNVGGQEALSILGMCRIIGEVLDRQPRFEHLLDKGESDLVGDVTLMKRLVDYNPQVSFKEGIRKMVESGT
jgi:UDP-glucose 4-epimerase